MKTLNEEWMALMYMFLELMTALFYKNMQNIYENPFFIGVSVKLFIEKRSPWGHVN